jgi:non-specific serine/threonine protein kinase/serine/threonine-protein kinase
VKDAFDVSRLQRVEEELAGSRAALEASRTELRRVIGRLVAAEEEARRRISQELHDDVCQRLAALALELRVVRRKLPGGDPQRIELDAVAAQMVELGEDLRRLSHDLHPAILERRGLAEALHDLGDEIERRCSLPVRLTLHGTGTPLPRQMALGLYRIAQEALANVIRHAGAREARLTMTVDDGAVHLAVADDGAGFDTDEVSRGRGLGLAGIGERARWLGGLCRISSSPGAGTEIDVNVPLPSAANAGLEPAERRVGPYEILDEIGTGSMATVYLAQEPEPLGRRVALKLHRGPLPGRWETLRFRAEQQALARLHHPAIAQVYEARTTEEGDLYIAMEYVPGLPITAYCDRYSLDLGRRLQLFAAVCEGVQHAHQKGVLHRDLKPSNILVTEEEGTPRPKIIGFGVAQGEIDARSDVYALGAVLCELLTGSVLPTEDATGPRRKLTGDLGRMVLAALAPDPAERYPTVEALGSEVGRVLRGEPVEVGPSSAFHQLSRLVRRHRRFVASAALVFLALAGGLVATTLQARRAERETVRADAVAQFLEELFRSSDPRQTRGEVPDTREILRRGTERLGKELRGQPLLRAQLLDTLGGIHTTLGLFDEARPLLQEALAIRERLHGSEDLEVAATLVRLGALAHLSGKDDAAALFKRALDIRKARLGEQHPDVADALNKLGTAQAARGHFDEAETTLRRSLALHERLWGDRDPRVAKVLHNLGGIAYYRGRMDDAERLLQSALAIREKTLAADDPDLGGSLEALALLRKGQGRLTEAEELLERQAAVVEKIYGPDHPELARTLLNLGLVHKDLGDGTVARALLERARAIFTKKVDPTHPSLVKTLAELAALERKQAARAETRAAPHR